MEIGYSVPTLLGAIIKQAQDIASEARWMEFYAHGQQNADQIGAIEDTVFCIEQALIAVKENIEHLKGEEM
jgi:hypothetical protein